MLNPKGTQEIETERLRLRRICPDDAGDMFERWTSDAEVARYCVWSAHRDKRETKRLAELWSAAYADVHTYRWGICLKAEGDRLIGMIDVVEQEPASAAAEIGYALSRAYWHKGIVTEALARVLAYLFSCGYEEITACHDTRNPRSGAVMQKCGMRFESIRVGDVLDNSRTPRDSVHYRLMRDEYKALGG